MGQKLAFGKQIILHQTFHNQKLLAHFWVYFSITHSALTGQYQAIQAHLFKRHYLALAFMPSRLAIIIFQQPTRTLLYPLGFYFGNAASK